MGVQLIYLQRCSHMQIGKDVNTSIDSSKIHILWLIKRYRDQRNAQCERSFRGEDVLVLEKGMNV